MYLREMEPGLMRHMPSVEEPVQFADATNGATLVLPNETPGCRILTDGVLEVCTWYCAC